MKTIAASKYSLDATRPALSIFLSFQVLRKTILNNKKCPDLMISRQCNFERAGRVANLGIIIYEKYSGKFCLLLKQNRMTWNLHETEGCKVAHIIIGKWLTFFSVVELFHLDRGHPKLAGSRKGFFA